MSAATPRTTRRRILTASLGVAGAGVLWSAGAAHAAPARAATPAADPGRGTGQAAPDTWTRSTSENGWPVTGVSGDVKAAKIEGSNAPVVIRTGEVATVLLYVARRFHYEIATLEPGDVVGHVTEREVHAAYESNHLSGTALAIRPGSYPGGVKDGFFPHQQVVIRDILAECDGVVRWAGDDAKRPKESHFQIDVPPGDARLHKLAARFRLQAEAPGQGAGAPDYLPFTPPRLSRAESLRGEQRQSA
ncbi:hypothetical protein [Streptomyces sp. URMC 123]|uniref:hypothetical protein n=1 Tax=Streptomyces sp. URMC 123 TaxID=3423403 RepID=UPI003F1D8D4E